jgi:hypothetical protein
MTDAAQNKKRHEKGSSLQYVSPTQCVRTAGASGVCFGTTDSRVRLGVCDDPSASDWVFFDDLSVSDWVFF